MLGEVFYVDVAETSKSQVHGDVLVFNTLDFHALEELSAKVQVCSWSNNRSLIASEDSLISLFVFGLHLTLDVIG